MYTISIINQKGGVGKSTTAQALGIGLALRGYNALLLDLDPQGNLSYSLQTRGGPSTLEVITHEATAQEATQKVKAGKEHQIAIIPASPGLASTEKSLTQTGREYQLQEALHPLNTSYDFAILDTPPALGLLTINALTASDGAIIPAAADIFSLQGIGQLSETIRTVQQYTNPALQILGILLTRHSDRTILSRDLSELMNETAESLDTKVYAATIREAVAVKEAQASQTDILNYAPKGNATLDYMAFVDEVIQDYLRYIEAP